jgi:hypothetical protein
MTKHPSVAAHDSPNGQNTKLENGNSKMGKTGTAVPCPYGGERGSWRVGMNEHLGAALAGLTGCGSLGGEEGSDFG